MSGTITPLGSTTPIGFGADREASNDPAVDAWREALADAGLEPGWSGPAAPDRDGTRSQAAGAARDTTSGTSPTMASAGTAGAAAMGGSSALPTSLSLGGLGRAAAGLLGSPIAAPLTAAAALFWPSRVGDGTLAARGLPPGGGSDTPGEGGFTSAPGALQAPQVESFPTDPEAGRPRAEAFPAETGAARPGIEGFSQADADRLSAALPGFTINRAGGITVVQSTASKPSDGITWPDRRLQRKFGKHAADFGVGGNSNPQTAGQFKQALQDFVDQPGTLKIQGTYRGTPVTIYTDPGYDKVVLVGPSGEFVSGWKLNQDQSKNVKDRNSL